MKKRGIVFTVDAMIALVLALFLISSSILYLSRISEDRTFTLSLNNRAKDSLSALEFDVDLSRILTEFNQTSMQNYLNLLSDNICASLSIYDSSNSLIINSTKQSCIKSEQVSLSRRTFISNNEIYIARMEVWTK